MTRRPSTPLSRRLARRRRRPWTRGAFSTVDASLLPAPPRGPAPGAPLPGPAVGVSDRADAALRVQAFCEQLAALEGRLDVYLAPSFTLTLHTPDVDGSVTVIGWRDPERGLEFEIR